MADSITSTPKRKRSQLPSDDDTDAPGLDTASFSFDLHAPLEDGSASPRTKVAHRFRGLALESGGGVTGDGLRTSRSPEPRSIASDAGDEANDGSRKRVKMPDTHMPDAEDAAYLTVQSVAAPLAAPPSGPLQPEEDAAPVLDSVTGTNTDQVDQGSTSGPSTSVRFAVDPPVVLTQYSEDSDESTKQSPPTEASEALQDNSRSRKRAGTPPLTMRTNPAAADLDSEEPLITDPVRAALTWHEDEITVYDPEDSDDDGTGINGIGFKPTPAIAYARNVRRKQQLAEYRKREDREARTRRSLRRRGSPVPGLVELKEKVERRRVRFMESTAEVISTV